MLLLRDAHRGDLKGLQRLAAVLNSVNLPDNAEVLSALIERSVRSFAGRLKNPFQRGRPSSSCRMRVEFSVAPTSVTSVLV